MTSPRHHSVAAQGWPLDSGPSAGHLVRAFLKMGRAIGSSEGCYQQKSGLMSTWRGQDIQRIHAREKGRTIVADWAKRVAVYPWGSITIDSHWHTPNLASLHEARLEQAEGILRLRSLVTGGCREPMDGGGCAPKASAPAQPMTTIGSPQRRWREA
ncbi:hypothetical protein BJ165DRAFT_1397550 [Panaeolus papilionaceus]|nr:hypothetical protein BJ165DRAFT_1397550 [Panaeolus papilionaceus]